MSGFDFPMSDEPDDPSPGRAGVVVILGLITIVLVLAVILFGPIKRALDGGGDYSGSGSGSVTVVINSGDTASTIGSTLAKAGVVKSTSSFVSAASGNAKSREIGPGTYRLREHMQASQAVSLLLDPKARVDHLVTIPEGYTAAMIVARIAKDTPITAAALQSALNNPSALGLPSYANGKVEGFLFPATYDVEPGESATTLLKAMVTRYDQAASETKLAAGARRLGLSQYDVIKLASIVQREGGLVSDYPKIAEVFLNRIHDGMRLDSDATLYYILGPNHGQLTSADLQLNSPYNTRLNSGLPPTPINSPGQAAIDAVLHAPHGPYLYFVTIDKSGKSAFATNLAAFNQLAAESLANGVAP